MYVSKIRFYAIGGKLFNFAAKVQLFFDICKDFSVLIYFFQDLRS